MHEIDSIAEFKWVGWLFQSRLAKCVFLAQRASSGLGLHVIIIMFTYAVANRQHVNVAE
jgi:hypothetical protein